MGSDRTTSFAIAKVVPIYMMMSRFFILLPEALYDARQSSVHQKAADLCYDKARWRRKRIGWGDYKSLRKKTAQGSCYEDVAGNPRSNYRTLPSQ